MTISIRSGSRGWKERVDGQGVEIKALLQRAHMHQVVMHDSELCNPWMDNH